MPKDEEDPGEAIFVAVVALLVLGAIVTILVASGVIRDLLTGSIAVGVLVVYVAISTYLGPWIVKSGPTKAASVYDAAADARKKTKFPPLAYLFAFIMPGYLIGKSVRWLWALAFGERK